MKKLIFVFATFAIVAGAYTETYSAPIKIYTQDISNKQSQNTQNNAQDEIHPDGVIMQEGIAMRVKDGKLTTLDREMTMGNGTIVMKNGTCIKKNGIRFILKEGEHIDMSGNLSFININKD